MSQNEAYITIKDHKSTFPNRVDVRLINPSKTNVGQISRIELQKTNKKLREITCLNQWLNTAGVLKWFKSIEDKQNKFFMKYDIKDFYPSITKNCY